MFYGQKFTLKIPDLTTYIDVDFYVGFIEELNQGLWLSLTIIIPSVLIGLGLGIVVGTVRGTGYPRFLLAPLAAYVSLFRGTALVIQLVICYYGLPDLGMLIKPFFVEDGAPKIWELNFIWFTVEWQAPQIWRLLYMSPYVASVVTFSLCSGAYHSEYIRGAILSIKAGQIQAARALGFSRGQIFWTVIIPQAVRRAWPGCGNEIIYLIKYSSLAFLLSAKELTGVARSVADQTFRFTETYFVVGLYYLALVSLATWILHRVEKSWAIPGFGTQVEKT